jgi:hypothetical protein
MRMKHFAPARTCARAAHAIRAEMLMAGSLVALQFFAPVATFAQSAQTPAPLRPVNNDAPAWSEVTRWTVQREPLLRIGAVDGPPETTLTRVTGGAITPSGRIVVLDEGASTVRVYGSNGRYLTSIGRQGEGPGEFPAAHLSMKLIGEDSVLVSAGSSYPMQLISIRTRNAQVIRFNSATVSQLVGAGKTGSLSPAGGTSVFVNATATERPPIVLDGVPRHESSRLYWASLDLSWAIDLGDQPGQAWVRVPANPPPATAARASANYHAALSVPFPNSSRRASSSRGGRVCIGEPSEPRIRCFDRTGGGLEITWRQPADPITSLEAERWRANAQAGLRAGGAAAMASSLAMLRSVRLPVNKPYFGQMFLDAEMNLWVDIPSKGSVADSTKVHSVFDARGRYLGDVATPRSTTILFISGNRVLSETEDRDGVPFVILYELRKPGMR